MWEELDPNEPDVDITNNYYWAVQQRFWWYHQRTYAFWLGGLITREEADCLTCLHAYAAADDWRANRDTVLEYLGYYDEDLERIKEFCPEEKVTQSSNLSTTEPSQTWIDRLAFWKKPPTQK